jgi:hypothetical protein
MNAKRNKILKFIAISFGVYFSVATLLIVFGKSEAPPTNETGPSFSELYFDYSDLPELKSFIARDGSQLGYR